MIVLKKLTVILALTAMLSLQVCAQQSENDVICDSNECVFEILDKLVSNDPAEVEGAERDLGALVENAVSTGNKNEKTVIKESILKFSRRYYECNSIGYIFSLLPRFCTYDDAEDLYPLMDDENLADPAIRALGDIWGTGDRIYLYVMQHRDNLSHKAAFAYAIGKQEIFELEDDLILWLKDADESTKIEIYHALLAVRTNSKTTSIIERGANKLYKSKNVPTKIEGMKLLSALKGEKSLSMLYKSLKNKDKRIQLAALDLLKQYAGDEKVCAKTVKICCKNDAIVDVLNWLGEIKNDSQMEFVISQLSSQDTKVVEAAIRAVFDIDNPDGIAAVKHMFGGKYQEVITEAMVSYQGDYVGVLTDVIRGDNQQKYAALQILEERPVVNLNRQVRELVNSDNQMVKDKAFKVLKYVAIPSNASFLSALLEHCDDKYVEDVQLAIKSAMGNLPDAPKDTFASTLKHVKPNIMPRFYKVFAYFGTELTVNKLIEAYESGDYKRQAKEALLLVENDAYKDRIKEVLKH